jgi:hypothetical protein
LVSLIPLARIGDRCYKRQPHGQKSIPSVRKFALSCQLPAIVRTCLKASLLISWCALLAGCADGPLTTMHGYMPWIRKDWDADEAYTTTYHRKVTDLADLRERAPSLPPADQQRFSAELAAELQKEQIVVMRAAIVKTLSAFPTEQASAAIQMAAKDTDPYVRREACVALAKTPNEASMQVLGETLATDSDPDVRLVAAKSLGQFKDPKAAEFLAKGIDDNNPALQQATMDSLRVVTGKNYGYSASAWREYMQGGSPTPPPGPTLAQQFRENWWWW